jgi:hypothetical protein
MFGESDLDAFDRLVAASGAATEVLRRDWYPAARAAPADIFACRPARGRARSRP